MKGAGGTSDCAAVAALEVFGDFAKEAFDLLLFPLAAIFVDRWAGGQLGTLSE